MAKISKPFECQGEVAGNGRKHEAHGNPFVCQNPQIILVEGYFRGSHDFLQFLFQSKGAVVTKRDEQCALK